MDEFGAVMQTVMPLRIAIEIGQFRQRGKEPERLHKRIYLSMMFCG